MSKNLIHNEIYFEKTIKNTAGFKNFSFINNEEDNYVSVSLYDSLSSISNKDSVHHIFIGENESSIQTTNWVALEIDIIAIEFIKNDSLKVFIHPDTSLVFKNWGITFQGNYNDSSIDKLLTYFGKKRHHLDSLKMNLSKINCFGLKIDKNFISIFFAGHTFRNFNYKIPRDSTPINQKWKHIQNNYYWHFFDSHISCGMTVNW